MKTPLSSSSDHGVSENVDPSNKTFVPKTEPRKVNLERPRSGLVEDPQGPTAKPNPSNYQTKVTDPTGKGTYIILYIQGEQVVTNLNFG